jgi:hypothetical protein
MAKSKGRGRNRARGRRAPHRRPNRSQRSPKLNLLKKPLSFLPRVKRPALLLWSLIGAIALIFGVFVGYVQLAPRISVSASAPLNPSDPFSSPFVISNDGYLPIRNVQFLCRLSDVNAQPPGLNLSFENISVMGPDRFLGDKSQKIRDIDPGGQATTKCNLSPLFPVMPIENADIAITVVYQPAFYRSQKVKDFRFITVSGSDGQLRWVRQPSP